MRPRLASCLALLAASGCSNLLDLQHLPPQDGGEATDGVGTDRPIVDSQDVGTEGGNACTGGLTDCSPDPTAVVCVDTQTDPAHCGDCGTACPAGSGCTGGQCVCPGGVSPCNGGCPDFASDPANCGACGRACAMGAACRTGLCFCPSGSTDCGEGFCVTVHDDPLDCGMCGTRCAAAQVCTSGSCVCANGTTNPMGTCVSPCTGYACPTGSYCVSAGGTIGCTTGSTGCPSGLAPCGTECVSFYSDPLHCGSCDNVCGGGEWCVRGTCCGVRFPTGCGQNCTATTPLPASCVCPPGSHEACWTLSADLTAAGRVACIDDACP